MNLVQLVLESNKSELVATAIDFQQSGAFI